MELEVGMRVVRASGEFGFVADVEKRRCWMVEVRWELSGIKEWIPVDQVKRCPLICAPTAKPLTSWGKTTPSYLVKLRKSLRDARPKNYVHPKEKQLAAEKFADELLSLSSQRKNRSRQKAKLKIQGFEKRYLSERISRDDRHDRFHT